MKRLLLGYFPDGVPDVDSLEVAYRELMRTLATASSKRQRDTALRKFGKRAGQREYMYPAVFDSEVKE